MGEGLIQTIDNSAVTWTRTQCNAPPARRPVSGWYSLTECELRVAELVSHGHTYRAIGERLYVSRRTVETHVAHAFTKLGVESKAALASAYVIRFGA